MDSDFLKGKQIREYRIVDQLGHGGMALVFKVEHALLKTFRAMKVIRSDLAENPRLIARFEREARLLVGLDHPNLVRVHDFFKESGCLFLVMEYVPGDSLAERFERQNRLPAAQVHEIVEQVCAGLSYAHRHGIIHRDLSPDNIMITQLADKREQIKVIDFGIAKAITENEDDSKSQFNTTSGKFIGKPSYCSPEQAAGKDVDSRTDIYSLGLIVHKALTGGPAFESRSYLEALLARINKQPLSLFEAAPDLAFTPKLEAALARTLERRIGKRFPTIDDCLDAMRKGFREYYRVQRGIPERLRSSQKKSEKSPVQLPVTDDDDATFDPGNGTSRQPLPNLFDRDQDDTVGEDDGTEVIPVQTEDDDLSTIHIGAVQDGQSVYDDPEASTEVVPITPRTVPDTTPEPPHDPPADTGTHYRSPTILKPILNILIILMATLGGVGGIYYGLTYFGLDTQLIKHLRSLGVDQPTVTPKPIRVPGRRRVATARPTVFVPSRPSQTPEESPTAAPTESPSPAPSFTPPLTPTPTPAPVATAVARIHGTLPAIHFTTVSGARFTRREEIRDGSGTRVEQKVEISRKYMISDTEITQELYELVMGENPSRFKAPNLPVHNVSWYEAVEFCNRLSRWEGLESAYNIERYERSYTVSWNTMKRGYRLPTEAEWEYIGRAGKDAPFVTGETLLESAAVFNRKSGPEQVGSKHPSSWNVFDIHGNVAEWVWDGYGHYSSVDQRNPSGDPTSPLRTVRGGGWSSTAEECAFTFRQPEFPYEVKDFIGFRIVRNY